MSGGFALSRRREIVDSAFGSHFPMRLRPADHRQHPRPAQKHSSTVRARYPSTRTYEAIPRCFRATAPKVVRVVGTQDSPLTRRFSRLYRSGISRCIRGICLFLVFPCSLLFPTKSPGRGCFFASIIVEVRIVRLSLFASYRSATSTN